MALWAGMAKASIGCVPPGGCGKYWLAVQAWQR